MVSLTAVILARDEAGYIGGGVDSLLPLTEDVIVIDSGSRDATVQIAREHGARVVERPWPGFAAQRNAALELAAESDWLLFVDADERLTPKLRAEISAAIESPGLASAFMIPRRNVIAGHVMRGGGWWPDYQTRLMRPGHCHYDERMTVHEVPHCAGPHFALNTPMVHLNFRSWGQFAARQFAYERIAPHAAASPARRAYLSAPTREFWRRFVGEKGYRDGRFGVAACAIMAAARLYGVWSARRSAT